MAKGYKILTTKEWAKLRKFHELGLTNKQIVGLTGRSAFTVSGAKRFEDLEDYRQWNRDLKSRQRQPERKGTDKTVEETNQMDEFAKLGDNVVEYLKSISKSLKSTHDAMDSFAEKTTKIMEMQNEMIKSLNDRLHNLEKSQKLADDNTEQPF